MFKAQTKILKTCHATTTQLKCAEKYHLGENEQRSQIGATNFATDLKVWGSGLPLTLFQHLSTLCVIVLVCCFYFPISLVFLMYPYNLYSVCLPLLFSGYLAIISLFQSPTGKMFLNTSPATLWCPMVFWFLLLYPAWRVWHLLDLFLLSFT